MTRPDPHHHRLFDVEAAHPKALAIAQLTIDRWQEIASILTPIVGQREATQFFERSIHLCNETYPWMGGSSGGFQDLMNLNDLQRSIAQQPVPIAAAGATLLLGTFQDLFASVVGPALAAQLLPASLIQLPRPDDAT